MDSKSDQDLPPHVEYMLDDYTRLQLKRDLLEAFIKTDRFRSLDMVDRTLMELQYEAMSQYSKVLRLRLTRAGANLPALT